METMTKIIEFIFGSALFINAILFIPQAIKIFKTKSIKNISFATFSGFLLIQFAIILHGIINKDYLLTFGYLLSVLTCGMVVILAFYYKLTNKKLSTEDIDVEDLFEQLPGHIYWKDRNGVWLWCNAENWKDFGLKSLKDCEGKTDYDVFPKEQADKLWQVDQEIIRTGQPRIVEEESTSIDNKIKIYLSHKVPLRNASSKIIGLLGISFDITEAKKINTEKLEMLEDIIGLMPGHVYWVDKKGVYLGCNDNQARSAGLSSRKEIIGKRNADLPWNFNAGELPETLDNINMRVIETGKIITLEEPAILKDGTKAIFLSSKVPMYNRYGETIGMVGISIDITDRKQKEEELVLEKNRAEAANIAKTEFLQNIRHDIRTPLVGIVGCAEHIKHTESLSKVKEYSELLIKSSNALLNFLNDIVDSIEATSGNIPILKKKFNLESVLLETIKINQAVAYNKQLDLKLEYDYSIPKYLIGDPRRLYRIIFELVVNGLKYTQQGSITVIAQLEQNDNGNIIVKVAVKDTGIGIPSNKQEDIFNQFVRLTPSFQDATYGGSGLGLTVVKKFLHDLGAEIHVTSEVNKGSTFTCVFSFKEALLSEELGVDSNIIEKRFSNIVVLPERSSNNNSSKLGSNLQASRRILLVEDNDITAKIIRDMLLDLDCQVDVANEGALAISLAEKNNYDIIFMDLGLPDITGYEVTEQIRSNKKNKSVPIIGLTAHANAEDKQHCLVVGMNVVFIKPLMREKIESICNMFVPIQPEQKATKPPDTNRDKNKLLVLTGDVFDLKLGIKLTNGDERLAYRFLEMLVNSFPEDLEKIDAAYKIHDIETVKLITHKLRGGLSYCAVPRLKEACARFDNYLRSGETELIEDLYSQFLLEFSKVKQEVENLRLNRAIETVVS